MPTITVVAVTAVTPIIVMNLMAKTYYQILIGDAVTGVIAKKGCCHNQLCPNQKYQLIHYY